MDPEPRGPCTLIGRKTKDRWKEGGAQRSALVGRGPHSPVTASSFEIQRELTPQRPTPCEIPAPIIVSE